MIIRRTTTRIWTIISVCSLGVCTTACDSGELPGKKETPDNTELRFSASISDSTTTKAYGAEMMEGTAFPNGTHTFGMFITNGTGSALATGSDDNMQSILTKSSSSESWEYKDKNSQTISSLQVKQGETVNITGYSPWVSGATVKDGVPFDLSGDATTWKDLLYLSSPTGSQSVTDGTPIALTFSHAFCWVTIKLSKLTTTDNVDVTAVSLENSTNSTNGIMVSGTINPKTGDVNKGGTSGSLVIMCNSAVKIPYIAGLSDLPAEFNFLVPSFMSTDMKDSDVVIRITTKVPGTISNETEVLSFPLSLTHMNYANGMYGFEKGKHNTYNVVYNNSEMVLSLSDWQEVTIAEEKLGEGTAGVTSPNVSFSSISGSFSGAKPLKVGNHLLHNYLGEVAENNNGEYYTTEVSGDPALFVGWKPFLENVPFYPNLTIAKSFGAGGAMIPWKDAVTGALLAKQACIDLRDGGYKDWRLPRISELIFLAYSVTAPSGMKNKADQLWSATEFDAEKCFATGKKTQDSFILPVKSSKYDTNYVRCVRDTDKQK